MTTRHITSIVPAQTMSEGVGAIVHRTIGTQALDALDPFLLLDEFTSQGGAQGGGFPDHPHRGFETVTYMLEGRMEHADNKGNRGIIGPGAIQWMTAGSGLVHSEMPVNEEGAAIRGMQLWVNLPCADKMKAPRYQELGSQDIPQIALQTGGSVRVIAGDFNGISGAATGIATQPLYLDISLLPNEEVSVPVPQGHSSFAYGLEGGALSGDKKFGKRDLALFGPGEKIDLTAGPNGARFILAAACPLKEPIARHGPFVMNTKEEIHQAFADFRAGKF